MRIGVISRIIGVPPTGENGVIAAYGGTGGLLEQYPSGSGPIINYAGGYVKLGGDIYFQFTSTVEGELYVMNYIQDWKLVDPDDGYAEKLDQTVVIGNNCIRLITPSNATYSTLSIKVKNLNGWYYTFTNELNIPTFMVLGYLLTEYPTDAYLGFSLRKLKDTATKCITVTNAAGTVTQDIDLDPVTEFIDVAALQAFCGSNDGFVHTLFNQNTDGVSDNLTAAKNYRPRIWKGSTQQLESSTYNGKTNYVINMAYTDSGTNTARFYSPTMDFTNCPFYQLAGVFAQTNPTANRTAGICSISTGPGGSETVRVHCGVGTGSATAGDCLSVYSAAGAWGYSASVGHRIKNYFVQMSVSVKAATDDGFGGSNQDGELRRAWDSHSGDAESISGNTLILPPDTSAPNGTFRLGYSLTFPVTSGLKFCELVVWKGDTYDNIWETIKNFQCGYYQTE